MERQQGGAVEAWTNDALQWRHVVYLFRFVRSFVFFTSKYWLSKRDKKYTARRVHKSCGYTYVLKTNERIRQKWTRKNLRIDDDSVDISCVDVTGIFFFCFVGRVKFSQLSTSSSVWWCVHKCRKSGSWEISSSTKPKLVTGAGRDTRGGKITSRKTGDSPIGMRGIGMQIRRRHQSISQQRKNEKHWTTRNRLEIFFSRGFPTRCDRAGNQTKKQKKNSHRPTTTLTTISSFQSISSRDSRIQFSRWLLTDCYDNARIAASQRSNPNKTQQNGFFLLGCHCCFPPFQKQSNNIIFTLSLPKQKITKKSHHQTDRSITNDSERHAK